MEEKKTMKKFSMSEIANMTTLKPEEMEEAESQAEALANGDANEGEAASQGYTLNHEEEKAEPAGPAKMEHTGETVTLTAKPTFSDLIRFMFRHTYLNFIGILGLLISVAAIVLLIIGYGRESTATTIIILVVALMFTVISPGNILLRANKQAKLSAMEGKAITYTLSDAGVDMSRGEEYASFTWDKIFKILEGKQGFYVYLASNQAFVLPFGSFEGDVDKLREIFIKNVPAKKCKVKKNA